MDPNLRPTTFDPPRRRWPGVTAAVLVGLAIAAIAVASWTDLGSVLHLSQADGLWLDEGDITALIVAAR